MKKWSSLALLFSLILFMQSCWTLGPSVKGNGEVTEETRQIENFSQLEASTGLDVFLIADTSEYVIVEADENLHKDIQTVLKGKTLKIFSESRIRWAESKKIFVHYKNLAELSSSSGATVRSQNDIKSQNLEIDASSGSQQYLQINTNRMEGHCSSGAHIYLSGKSDKADIKASSGAHFKGPNFRVTNCNADASSGAHIWVDVTDEINAEASSGGQIYYSGDPSNSEIKTSSGGSVSRN